MIIHLPFSLRFLPLFLTAILWCTSLSAHPLDCDLIFVVESRSDFSNAITDATAQKDSIKVMHVGIIYLDENQNPMVIEASPRHGVREIPLNEFMADAPKINNQPGVKIKRLNIAVPKKKIIENARQYLGCEYDWWYLPDNNRLYCSELVYESFRDEEGNYIFSSHPMNFRNQDGEIPQFWVDLFNSLGMEVPEGVEGTNPQDIFNDPRLEDAEF